VAQDLHQQPAVSRQEPLASAQRLLRRLHARLHADDVADLALQPGVEADEEIDRALAASRGRRQKGLQQRPRFAAW
jgi:hypothetical protein